MAFDPAGNLYVINSQGGVPVVSKITPAGVISTFASGFSEPDGLVCDSAGNVFVADDNAHTISMVTPSGAVSAIATNAGFPEGLAFDSAGTLYFAETTSGSISKLTPTVVVPFTLGGTAVAG